MSVGRRASNVLQSTLILAQIEVHLGHASLDDFSSHIFCGFFINKCLMVSIKDTQILGAPPTLLMPDTNYSRMRLGLLSYSANSTPVQRVPTAKRP